MIWKKLIVEDRKIVISSEIQNLARKLSKEPIRSLKYLQEHGYIYRIFKGIYYVKNPNEREKSFFEDSVYEIVAKGLKIKGVKHYYFGLETALKINNMTHEYFTVNFVITDSYRTTKIINILDTKFHFLKWNQKHFTFGILNKNNLKYSDKEKSVLDLTYKKYRKNKESKQVFSSLYEFEDSIDKNKVFNYLEHYPRRFKKIVKGII